MYPVTLPNRDGITNTDAHRVAESDAHKLEQSVPVEQPVSNAQPRSHTVCHLHAFSNAGLHT